VILPSNISGRCSEPPGFKLPRMQLNSPVVTCEQAAAAKKIPLENELKTLVLYTSCGLHSVHVRGDHRVSMRKVKRFLSSDEAFMLAPEELAKLGLAAGTVSPILPPLWEVPHLISESVIDLDFVSTNAGTLLTYFRFSPRILLGAPKVFLGDFEG